MRATLRPVMTALLLAVCAWAIGLEQSALAADPAHAEFFEKEIRPLLIASCVKCHGPDKQEGQLRLDSRNGLAKGGETGVAFVAGKPDQSLLITAVRRQGDVRMPPDKPLSQPQVDALTRWVELGAPWPEAVVLTAKQDAKHWAFEPVREPAVPAVKNPAWVQTPIDAFVLAKLEANGFAPSPAADRRTLIRRAKFDLLGLPPTPDEVDAFVRDEAPQAYERLIDRLLASPHYGEKQARQWLDIARYSDSKGYVYAREERFWSHAWAYRDWVVRAINANLPYDRFLLLQLAADQVEAPREDLAAMGFLTLGRRFLGVTHDIIDDRIDVVTRGTMGLTVACARCHDHKYDPIPTRDYYSLYGVFKSSVERLTPLADVDANSDFGKKLAEFQEKLRAGTEERRKKAADRVRMRVGDYLMAQLELHKYPEEGFDQILEKTDIIPAFVRRWKAFLERTKGEQDVVFGPWCKFSKIPADKFAERAEALCRQIQAAPNTEVHSRIAQAFTRTPKSMADVAEAYTKAFVILKEEWERWDNPRAKREHSFTGQEPLLEVLYGSRAPCEVPNEPIVSSETYFTSGECTEIWKLQGDVERHLINSPQAPPVALQLVDCEITGDARVLKRGNAAQLGDVAPRQFLAALTGPQRKPFQHGSGRLELARAIIEPQNPLTARVAVNRVWLGHFGAGLSRTPSDFGRRVDTPSHPELLDWLAARFVAEGWDLKKLHRQIMLSAVYQQDSHGPADPQQLARLQQTDPENRLLWKMNVRRLSFEELRDAGLAVTGELQLDLGGKAGQLFGSNRRTLYTQVDRQFLPSVLRAFDFANPDLHIPQRAETIVPQQALFFMNHPFLLQRAQALARLSGPSPDAAAEGERIRKLYRAVYQRDPTATQVAAAQRLLHSVNDETPPPAAPQTVAWKYGFGEYQAEPKRVAGFQPLPHFTGKAWQGGPAWPDTALGWVQLTADGGHAGNDKQHAAIRRWTAPAAMKVQLQSKLVHSAQPGDGVRAYLVSSRQGLFKTADVHHREERFDLESIEVEAGETLDFVVDLLENLNHEEYVWEAKLTEQIAAGAGAGAARTGQAWDSRRDFVGTPTQKIGPWEQLAQVLLAANEFLFVD